MHRMRRSCESSASNARACRQFQVGVFTSRHVYTYTLYRANVDVRPFHDGFVEACNFSSLGAAEPLLTVFIWGDRPINHYLGRLGVETRTHQDVGTGAWRPLTG